MSDTSGLWFQQLMSLLLKKIVVPKNYHDQVREVKLLLQDDVSGIIDSLTDFAVESASVNYDIQTENQELTRILNTWLSEINTAFEGQIPSGVNNLAKEYFKERWKSSSFPILKISAWEAGEGNLQLPSKMFFVDGESVYAEQKGEGDEVKVVNWDYYIGNGKDNPLQSNVIITKPYGRWYDKYPTPFLIKRGVVHNYKLIHSLKTKQSEILDQVIPYLFLVKKGSEQLAINKEISYSNDQLQEVSDQFQELLSELREIKSIDTEARADRKTPIRTTNFDEKIEHLIPDLSTIFEPKLFEQAERNILAGMGFIDVIDSASSTRRESILNPKPFIEDVKGAVEDFAQVIQEVINLIKVKNKDNRKYMNTQMKVGHSPVTPFLTDKFKERIRQLYDRGRISSKTAVEIIAEVDFEMEVKRREQEDSKGIQESMYPPVTQNQEGTGRDLPGEPAVEDTVVPETTTPEDQPDSKTDPVEKQNFENAEVIIEEGITTTDDGHEHKWKVDPVTGDGTCFDADGHEHEIIKWVVQESEGHKHDLIGVEQALRKIKDLVTSPFKTVKELPKAVRNNLSPDLTSTFLNVFNRAYNTYENDSIAMRVAWKLIGKIAKKKNGKWVRKDKAVLTKAMIEEVLDSEEAVAIDEAMSMRKIELQEGKKELLNKLIKKPNKDR